MVVVDSSFLIAYHNQRDVHHPLAQQAMGPLLAGEWGPGLLLEYVFLEVVTVLLARRGLDPAVRVATTLLEASELSFVPCSDIFLDALDAFRTQPRGIWSFTDAAIVAVARRRTARVLTFDQGFRGVQGLAVLPE